LGKRIEGGIRDIATDAHPIDECKNPNWFKNSRWKTSYDSN
jgi:hypothetical protein